MRDLQIGSTSEVKKGVFEPIYRFGYLYPDATDLLTIQTSHHDFPVFQISRQHPTFVRTRIMGLVAQPAAVVNVGDFLVLYSSDIDTAASVVVESIEVVLMHDGVFAPFTLSRSKLLVNGGLLVSLILALDESLPKLVVVGIKFSYHWLSHAFEFPHRVAYHYITKCPRQPESDEVLSTRALGRSSEAILVVAESRNAFVEGCTSCSGLVYPVDIRFARVFGFRNWVLVVAALLLTWQMKGVLAKF